MKRWRQPQGAIDDLEFLGAEGSIVEPTGLVEEEAADDASVAFLRFDLEGRIEECNAAGAVLLDRDRAEILGVPFHQLVRLEDPGSFLETLRRCARAQGWVVQPFVFSTSPTRTLTVKSMMWAVFDARHELVGCEAFFNDQSGRARGEPLWPSRIDQRARTRFEAIDRATMVVLRSMTTTPRASTDEVLQVIVEQARLVADAQCVAFYGGEVHPDARCVSGPPEATLAVVVRTDARLVGTLVLRDKRNGEAFTTHDRRSVEILAEHVGIALELARLQAAAEEAIRSRDQLLAIVAHDLRTPLSTIAMGVGALSQLRPVARGEGKRKLELIRRSAARMERLIDDLLTASVIEAGRLVVERRPEEVAPLLDDAVVAAEVLAAPRSIRVVRSLDADLPAIHCDRERLFQVLANLVGNAVKFAPEGSTVQIAARRSGDQVRFSVADRGPGIPPDVRERLFDRYWKGPESGRRGFGLGLSIAKGIVEAHGGSIAVDSKAGQGTVFSFQIACAQSP